MIIGDSRKMKEVSDESVHLVITSPPYWQLKDYGTECRLVTMALTRSISTISTGSGMNVTEFYINLNS